MSDTMKLEVRSSTLAGTTTSPPSKSATHRAFIIASLAEGTSIIKNPLLSADTRASLDAVAAFGADIRGMRNDTQFSISGGMPQLPDTVIDVKNSGTTMRIATCLAALIDGMTVITGDASIRKRPMQQMIDTLNALGATCRSTRNNGCAPLAIEGVMKGGIVDTTGFVSSQFTSGLLIAAPLAQKKSAIAIPDDAKSRPYIDITLAMLRAFGIVFDATTKNDATLIELAGTQRYEPQTYTVPGDFSSAAFLLVNAAISNQKITLRNLDAENPQGDKAIIDILRAFGADVIVSESKKTVTVNGAGTLRGQEVSCADVPDLFPILSVLGAFSEGETVLHGAEHLRFKESDRIAAMAAGLTKMGAAVKERSDGMQITGGKALHGASINAHDDHRILMAFAVAGMNARGTTTISDAEAHRVSYPGFIDDILALGADAEVRE